MGEGPPADGREQTEVLTMPDPGAVLASLPDPVFVVDADGGLLWANRRAEEELGVDLDTARQYGVAHVLHPDDVLTALASLRSVQSKDVGTLVDVRLWDRHGRWSRYEVRGWSGLDDPQVAGVICVARRVDDRGGWSVAGGDATRLAAVLDWSPGLTMLLDPDGCVIAANRAFTTQLGIDVESVIGRPLRDLVVDDHAATVSRVIGFLTARGGGSRAFEATFKAGPSRRPTPFGLTAINLLEDDAVQAVVVSGVDIAALVEARTELVHRATHDPLTGLANRALVLESLAVALHARAGRAHAVGLVYLDLDGFKAINDTWGHRVGDEVLIGTAERLRTGADGADAVGRLGGDELVVVLVRPTAAEISAAAEAIGAALAPALETSVGPIEVAVSLGVAVAGEETRADELLTEADMAMYAKKRANRR